MKFLKYALGIILLLVLLFIAKGFITPTISYDSEITVDKSVEESWAVMNDESKTSQWLKDIKKIEHAGGEKGKVGAVTHYTFEDNGNESIVVETIKSIDPGKSISMDFVMEGVMTMDYKVEFMDENGKTKIKSATTTKGEGMMMRSMVSFMTGTMQAQEDENMANLQKLINENTTDYFPAPVVEEDFKGIPIH